MISIDDILDMSSLTRAEIEAIAEHEHLGRARAAALAEYTMHLPKGAQQVQLMICEDIREALHRDDLEHARDLWATLREFIAAHPEAQRGNA